MLKRKIKKGRGSRIPLLYYCLQKRYTKTFTLNLRMKVFFLLGYIILIVFLTTVREFIFFKDFKNMLPNGFSKLFYYTIETKTTKNCIKLHQTISRLHGTHNKSSPNLLVLIVLEYLMYNSLSWKMKNGWFPSNWYYSQI